MFQTYCKTKVKRNMVWNNDFLSQMFCCPELVTFTKTNSDVCHVTHFLWGYISVIYSYVFYIIPQHFFLSCDHWWSWIWKTFWIKATVLLNTKSSLVPNLCEFLFFCGSVVLKKWVAHFHAIILSPELSSYKKGCKHTIKVCH